MDYTIILNWLDERGIIVLFVIVFLEHLNMPGFPSGIIMPAAGIWASSSNVSLVATIIVSVLGGYLGCLVLYLLCYKWGNQFLNWYLGKFPKQKPTIDKYTALLIKNCKKTIFITRILPVIRTIISIPAGVLRMPIKDYTIYSIIGITIWNSVCIGGGYFLGEIVFTYFA